MARIRYTNTGPLFLIAILTILISANQIPSAIGFGTHDTGAAGHTFLGAAAYFVSNDIPKYFVHQGITESGLSFLRQDVIDKINTGHEWADFPSDNQNNPDYHFDSCTFDGATSNINKIYAHVASQIKSSDLTSTRGAYEQFGEIMHTAADFYSHSNWVELQTLGENYVSKNKIVDDGLSYWTELHNGDLVKGTKIKVVEGTSPDSSLSRPKDGHIVLVNNGEFAGLISGVADSALDPESLGNCPPNIAIGHWDPYYVTNLSGDHLFNIGSEKFAFLVGPSFDPTVIDGPHSMPQLQTGLNKDDEKRLFNVNDWSLVKPNEIGSPQVKQVGYKQARELAVKQTTHEWCRLMNIAGQQGPGISQSLFNKMVEPAEKEQALSALSDCGIHKPVANAGLSRTVVTNQLVTLDGTKSNDPDGRKLTYNWKFVSGPDSYQAALTDSHASQPLFFTADEIAPTTKLTFQLVVNNGILDSDPATVSITVRTLTDSDLTTYVVNTNKDDRAHLATDDPNYHCTLEHCSIQQAIVDANAHPGKDIIKFNLPTGQTTILTTSSIRPMPKITDPVIINGTTQPGYNGKPIVQLNGGGATTGLEISSGDSVVKGLALYNYGYGIVLIGSQQKTNDVGDPNKYTLTTTPTSGNVIEGNYVGSGIDSTINSGVSGNAIGIDIEASKNNKIGGLTPTERNVISGNTLVGIRIMDGIKTEEVTFDPSSGQYTYRDTPCDSQCASSNNLVQGNYIGTDSTGKNADPNGHYGIAVLRSHDNLIGGIGQEATARNIISGNGKDGILISGGISTNNLVEGNYIGIDVDGANKLPNQEMGVRLSSELPQLSSSSTGSTTDLGPPALNSIGNPKDVGGLNTISGNGHDGVYIGEGALANQVDGNYIGTDPTGVNALGNSQNGVAIVGSPINIIGGLNTEAPLNSIAHYDSQKNVYIVDPISGGFSHGKIHNIISGNGESGVSIVNDYTHTDINGNSNKAPATNLIHGNYIGTDVSGKLDLGNSGDGVTIKDASKNEVMTPAKVGPGSTIADPNVIAFNKGNGVSVISTSSGSAIGNDIVDNDVHGNSKLGIDLGNDGVTQNQDPASTGVGGPNDFMNHPTGIAYYSQKYNQTILSGKLNNATTLSPAAISIYANKEINPSGYGEGQRFLGFISQNQIKFNDPLSTFIIGLHDKNILNSTYNDAFGSTSRYNEDSGLFPVITTTANDNNNSTSEFSPGFKHVSPPRANAGEYQRTASGQTVTLNGTNSTASPSEPGTTIASYSWEQLTSQNNNNDNNLPLSVDLSGANTATPTFAAPNVNAPKVLYFRLTVTDGNGATDYDDVPILVTKSSQTPEYCSDNDNDWICNEVDTQPYSLSNFFSDISLGGTTNGTVVDRGSQLFTIREEPNPDGVRITDLSQDPGLTDISNTIRTDPQPANFNGCGGAIQFYLNAGDEVILTCSSADLQVMKQNEKGSQPIQVVYRTKDGLTANSLLTAGNKLIFDPITTRITAPSNNSNAILISTQNRTFLLEPGETEFLSHVSTINTTIISAKDTMGQSIKNGSSTNSSTIIFNFKGVKSSSPTILLTHFECTIDQTKDNTTSFMLASPCSSPSGFSDFLPGTYTFHVRAFDDTLFNAGPFTSFTWTVNSNITSGNSTIAGPNPIFINRLVADAGPNQTVDQGQTVTLQGGNSSSSTNELTANNRLLFPGYKVTYSWKQLGGPVVMINGSDTANPSFVAPTLNDFTNNSTLVFELTVSDSIGQVASDNASVFVNASSSNNNNNPHHLKAITGPDKTISASDDTLSLTADGTVDSQYNIVNYTWTQVAGPSLSQLNQKSDLFIYVRNNLGGLNYYDPLSFFGSTLPFYGSTARDTYTIYDFPILDNNSKFTFKLTVVDNTGMKASSLVNVNYLVADNTHHLTANGGPDQNIFANMSNPNLPFYQSFNLDDGGSSVDNTPPPTQISRSQWVQIAGPPISLGQGWACAYCFSGQGSDQVQVLPPLLDNNNNNTKFTFRYSIADDQGEVSSVVKNLYYVIANNTHHLVASTNNTQKYIFPGFETIPLDASASSVDPPANIVSYQWTQLAGPAVQKGSGFAGFFNVTSLSRNPTADVSTDQPLSSFANNTKFTFKLTVVDDRGEVSTDVVDIHLVKERPVTANAGPSQIVVNEGQPVTLNGTFNDPNLSAENRIISTDWYRIVDNSSSSIRIPKVNPIDSSGLIAFTRNFTFTTPYVQNDTILKFRFFVEDSIGGNASSTINVIVKNDGSRAVDPPVADAGTNSIFAEGSTTHLDGSNSYDSENSSRLLTYSWKQILVPKQNSSNGGEGGNAVVPPYLRVNLQNANTATPSFVVPNLPKDAVDYTIRNSDGSTSNYVILHFGLMVTNSAGKSANDTVRIDALNINQHPLAFGQFYSTNENTPANIVLKATDPDNDTISLFSIVSEPTNGRLEVIMSNASNSTSSSSSSSSSSVSGGIPIHTSSIVNATDQLVYIPDNNYTGQDVFKFKANDGNVDSANTATVLINILPSNYTAPSALSNGDLLLAQNDDDATHSNTGTGNNDNTGKVIKWFSPNGIFVKNIVIPSNTSSSHMPSSSSSTTTGPSIGIAYDPNGNFYVTGSDNTIKKFNTNGKFVEAYGTNNPYSKDYSLGNPIVFDVNGNSYVEARSNTGDNRNITILKYDPHGNYLARFNLENNYQSLSGNSNNLSSMALADNQCTLYYVIGTLNIKRFNVCSNTQLPDFGNIPISYSFKALSIVPNGGGILAATTGQVLRFDVSGNIIRTISGPVEMRNGEAVPVSLSRISIDPDGKSFWSTSDDSSTYNIYRFDIQTGNLIDKFSSGGNEKIDNLAVKGALPLSTVPNIPPEARDQTINVQGNTIANIPLTGTDLNKDALLFRIVSGTSNGKLGPITASNHNNDVQNPSADGTVTAFVQYTPNKGFSGIDHFVYKTTDTMADSNNATVNIVVSPPPANRPPTALGVASNTFVNSPTSVNLNGRDPDFDALTYQIIKSPSHGTITDFSNNSNRLTYSPDQGFEGKDSFVYKVNDGNVDSNNATVLLTVQPHVPDNVFLDVNVTKDYNNYLANKTRQYIHVINLTADLHGNNKQLNFGVLCVDAVHPPGGSSPGLGCVGSVFPAEGNSLTHESFGSDSAVNSTGLYSGQLTYKINPSQVSACTKDTFGTDLYTYEASDANGTFSNTGQITVHLHDFPVIKDCTIGPKPVLGSKIVHMPPIAYDTNDFNAYVLGDFSPNADNTVALNQNQSVQFDLKASAGFDQYFVTYDNVTYVFDHTVGTRDNLTYTIVTHPRHGNLTDFSPSTKVVGPDAQRGVIYPLHVKYIPAPGYYDDDSFVFNVNNGKLVSNNATIKLRINAPPPPPPPNNASKVGIVGGSTICTDTSNCQVTDANYIMNGGVLLSPDDHKYSFVPIPLPLSDSASGRNLSQFSTVILNVASQPKINGGQGLGCTTNSLNSTEKTALVSYMQKGGKLVIYDSECRPGVDYKWLPSSLQFSTFNPGQLGIECTVDSNCGATIVENNSLASNKPGDKYEIDLGNSGIPKPGNPDGTLNGLCAATDACGDANVMVGLGNDLCKSIVATIPTTTGTANRVTGTVYAYSKDGSVGAGKGMLIYNGFDLDDILFYLGSDTSGANALRKLLLQELDQPVNPSGLACSTPVVNHSPPIANAGLNQTVNTGSHVTLDASNSTDPDGGNIASYKWRQVEIVPTPSPNQTPVMVNLTGADTSKATFVAPNVVNDTLLKFELTVTDSDGGGNGTGIVYVLVKGEGSNNNQRLPPIAVAGPDQRIDENTQTVTLNGSASYDPDVQGASSAIKSYRWIQIAGPNVTLTSPNTATPTFTAPTVSRDTLLIFNLVVTDNDDNVSSTNSALTNVLVNNVNTPPIANAGGDQTVNENTTGVTLDGSKSTDNDGTITKYSWTQIAGPNVTLSNSNTATPTFTAPSVKSDTTLTFKLIVTDNDDASATAVANIIVKNVNVLPIANAGTNQTVNETATDVKLDGSESYDKDGNIASYKWVQTAGPNVTLSAADTTTPTFTAPALDADTNSTILTFALIVTDNDGAESINRANVSVVVLKQQPTQPTNQPPTVNNRTIFVSRPNTQVNVTLSGIDAEKSPLTFAIVSNPANGALGEVRPINETSAFVIYTPNANFTGTDSFTYKANDGKADSTNIGNVKININAIPIALKDRVTTTEDTPVNVNVLANDTDSDNDPLNTTSIATQPRNGNAVINTNNNTITYTPAAGFSGTDTFSYTVSDGHTDVLASTDVIITVNHINHPPIANAGIDQKVNENITNVTLNGNASSDPDSGDTITSYSWTQTSGPPVALSGSDSALPTFTAPSVKADTTLTFALTVSDKNNAVSKPSTVSVLVKNVNIPPIANAGTSQTVSENTTGVTLDGSKSLNADGSIASYLWNQTAGPTVVLKGADTAKPTFTSPTVNKDITLTFALKVTDNDGATSTNNATTNVLVKNVNIPPIASAGTNQTVDENTTNVVLDGSKSVDSDGTIISYSWKQISDPTGPTVTLANANTAKATFTAPSVKKDTTLSFLLTVTDNDGATSSASSSVLVGNVNLAPIANASADQTVNESSKGVTLDGSKSIDRDGTIALYKWNQTDGPTVSLANANSATPSFTAPAVNADTTLTFSLTVTDNDGATSTNTATTNVIVKPVIVNVNHPPIADAGTDQTVNEGAANVKLNGAKSSDPDTGDSISSYQWTQTTGPTVTLANPNSATPMFTAPQVSADTTLIFSLTVTDNHGAASTNTATTNVIVKNVNQLPTADAGKDQTVDENTANVKLNGTGSHDPDGTITSYKWTQIPSLGPTVTLSNANTANPAFTAPSVDTDTKLTFSLIVTDNDKGTSTNTATTNVLVKNVNHPPIANAGPTSQTVNEGTTNVRLDGTKSSDPDTGDLLQHTIGSRQLVLL